MGDMALRECPICGHETENPEPRPCQVCELAIEDVVLWGGEDDDAAYAQRVAEVTEKLKALRRDEGRTRRPGQRKGS